MSDTIVTIHGPRGTRRITLDPELTTKPLEEVLSGQGFTLDTRCGRHGLCGGCSVELIQGTVQHLLSGTTLPSGFEPKLINSCQYAITDARDVVLRVPVRSVLGYKPQIVTSFRFEAPLTHQPLWQHVSLNREDLATHTDIADAVRDKMASALPADCSVDTAADWNDEDPQYLDVIHATAEYQIDRWLIRRCSCENTSPAYGIAIDLGTTTIVAMLIDLDSEEAIATASGLNAQVELGDNVLTRIDRCLRDTSQVDVLRRLAVERTLSDLIDDLLAQAGASVQQIRALTVAGNATMLHLLAGVDPSSMGTAPFTPVFLDHRVLPADEVLFTQPSATVLDRADTDGARDLMPQSTALVHLLPGAAAYVGADIVSGVYSTGMVHSAATCLLVDIGTNGEIVLKRKDQLVGCATAAGPAFEGAGLAWGSRATQGAISHIRLDASSDALTIDVIGDTSPIGICGTGYIDFIAQARQRGWLNSTGRITPAAEVSNRVLATERGRGFHVARTESGQAIVILEADIAALLQAKAAIATGIICLLGRFDLKCSDVKTLYLAGGFGFHMDVDNLIRCGLLSEFESSQVEVVGNTSLGGAYQAMLDRDALEKMKELSRRIDIVELNLEPDFQTRYIDQLSLP